MKKHNKVNKKNDIKDKKANLKSVKPINENSLVNDLKAAVGNYLQRGAIYTLSNLAIKSKVPYSTVRRILHGQGIPDFATVLSILGQVCSLEDRRVFLYKNYPKQSNIFYSTFKDNKKKSSSKPYIAGSELSDLIIYHCYHHDNANIENIAKLYGEFGVYKCLQLEKLGYISINQNGDLFYNSTEKAYNAKLCLKDIEILSRSFNTKNIDNKNAIICSITESISLEGLKQIKALGISYVKKIRKITEDHPGDQSYYVALIQNVFDTDTFNDELCQSNNSTRKKEAKTIRLKT